MTCRANTGFTPRTAPEPSRQSPLRVTITAHARLLYLKDFYEALAVILLAATFPPNTPLTGPIPVFQGFCTC